MSAIDTSHLLNIDFQSMHPHHDTPSNQFHGDGMLLSYANDVHTPPLLDHGIAPHSSSGSHSSGVGDWIHSGLDMVKSAGAVVADEVATTLGFGPRADAYSRWSTQTLTDSNASLGDKTKALVAGNIFAARDLFVTTPLTVVGNLGSSVWALGGGAVGWGADLLANPSPSTLDSHVVQPVHRATDSVLDFLTDSPERQADTFFSGAHKLGSALWHPVSEAYDRGRPGLAAGEALLLGAGAIGTVQGLRTLGSAGTEAFVNQVGKLPSETGAADALAHWPGTLKPVPTTVEHSEFMSVNFPKHMLPEAEDLVGTSIETRHLTIYPPFSQSAAELDINATAAVLANPRTYSLSDVPHVKHNQNQSYTVTVSDGTDMGGARLAMDWDGWGAESWAQQKWGLRDDGTGTLVANVPPHTSYFGNLFAAGLRGSGQEATEAALLLAERGGQERVVGYTTDPLNLNRYAKYDAPGPFVVTDAAIKPNAEAGIRAAIDKVIMPVPWLGAADKANLSYVPEGLSVPWGNGTLAPGIHHALASERPLDALHALSLEEKLQLPPATARFDFEWTLGGASKASDFWSTPGKAVHAVNEALNPFKPKSDQSSTHWRSDAEIIEQHRLHATDAEATLPEWVQWADEKWAPHGWFGQPTFSGAWQAGSDKIGHVASKVNDAMEVPRTLAKYTAGLGLGVAAYKALQGDFEVYVNNDEAIAPFNGLPGSYSASLVVPDTGFNASAWVTPPSYRGMWPFSENSAMPLVRSGPSPVDPHGPSTITGYLAARANLAEIGAGVQWFGNNDAALRSWGGAFIGNEALNLRADLPTGPGGGGGLSALTSLTAIRPYFTEGAFVGPVGLATRSIEITPQLNFGTGKVDPSKVWGSSLNDHLGLGGHTTASDASVLTVNPSYGKPDVWDAKPSR